MNQNSSRSPERLLPDLSSRRVFVGGLATAAAAALFPRFSAEAPAGPRRIDVHHHFTPPAYLEYTKRYNTSPSGRGGAGRDGAPPAAGRGRGQTSAFPGWKL